jgi:predicted acyltransferase
MTIDPKASHRIVSLDQFRGYTVAGMLLVNFLGGFRAVHALLKHHNTYCSYADTIMPQFFFAVGFAYRLTFLRRLQTDGYRAAAATALRRNLGLILVGFVVYHLDGKVAQWDELRSLTLADVVARAFRREPFQALVHIALTSIWALPVIASGAAVRLLFLLASAGLHFWLSSRFYLDWAWKTPVIDGGPLGFLSWTIPLLVGSLAYDLVAALADDPRRASNRLLAWSVPLMLAGYALACAGGTWAPPPFVPPTAGRPVDLWTMSQRTGSTSYLTFAAGFSLAVYALFVRACDLGRFRSRVFRTFGVNALAAYVIHPLVAGAVKPYAPNDSPLWYVAAAFGFYFAICYAFNRYLEEQRIFLKL